MKRFTRLFAELDASNRTNAKLAALERYFREAPPEDAAWALFFLTGNRFKRPVTTRDLRAWAAELSGFPAWMVEACHDHAGDLAETLALLVRGDEAGEGAAPALHRLVEERIARLREMDEAAKRRTVETAWRSMGARERLVFNKLITGGFRVGVSRTLVNRALANVAGVEPAVMAHRLMGDWRPGPGDYRRLVSGDATEDDPAKPYPFYLAYPLDEATEADLEGALGPVGRWRAEWKWDGFRAQLIKRAGMAILWSRGEERVETQFPEIAEAAAALPDGTVIDGEVLAWDAGRDRPLTFGFLQRRLGRKTVGKKLRAEAPAAYMAFDLLEDGGADIRAEGTDARRARLDRVFESAAASPPLRRSADLAPASWDALARWRSESRARAVEGCMLKKRDAPYGVGRVKGAWWKWKIEPHTADAVLVYAQQGHGKRAGLYTDYTFSVWRDGELVPFAKAYSGLTDREIRRVDRWIRDHTVDHHGPVRVVEPELVFEIAFEGIMPSNRHKSGLAVRFPRIQRWRGDKSAAEADSLDTLKSLLPSDGGGLG